MDYAVPYEAARVVKALCRDISTPYSEAFYKALEKGDWPSLLKMGCHPGQYKDALSYKLDASLYGLFRKCEDIPGQLTSKELEDNCVADFFLIEKQNFRINKRLEPYLFNLSGCSEGVRGVISRARKMVRDVLGPPPLLIEGRFGPGTTYGDKGLLSTIPDKMQSLPTLTTLADHLLPEWSETAWARAQAVDGRSPSLVLGNRFATVPKTYAKRRSIAIEPSINQFYQLGVGSCIKQRLRRFGWNLLTAQPIHRELARKGSIDGSWATLDLSNASDTVCKNLVEILLPKPWFSLLNSLRSPRTQVRGKWVLLEKFSSMGNGFTFELETLIFSSLIFAVTGLRLGSEFFVFGDDIIIPPSTCSDVIACLEFFGFTINKDKSFTEGPFRESCGGDFFLGMDVRPFSLKRLPREPEDFIRWANGHRRMAPSHDHFDLVWGFYRTSWYRILDALPSRVRGIRGPETLGDIVIHDHPDRWVTKPSKRCSSTRLLRTWSPFLTSKMVGWVNFKPDVVLASALYGCGDGLQGVIPKDPTFGYRERYIPYS